MKIKCINDGGWEYLTIGKIYEVFYIDKYYYKINNDNGYKHWYSKDWFKTLSEIRNDKIDKLLR
jgi:hypothetical protein